MRLVAVSLLMALIFKDVSHLGDRFLMRGTVELISLSVGLWWLLIHADRALLARHALLFGYASTLMVSSLLSDYSAFATLQVLAFWAVVVFSVAAVESDKEKLVTRSVLDWVFFCLTVVCLVSLLASQVAPDSAFMVEHWTGRRRFNGLFGMPSLMGSCAGIVMGLAVFYRLSPRRVVVFSVLRLVAFSAAGVCIYLTGSRTFWVAVLVSVSVTSWFYTTRKFRVYGILAIATGVVMLGAELGDVRLSKDQTDKILRAESLEKLSGRTSIWSEAFEAVRYRPILGYGFGVGGMALFPEQDGFHQQDDESAAADIFRLAGRVPTLHNGYVQAIVDSGIFGFSFYLATIVTAMFRLLRLDRKREHATVAFVLLFLTIANGGESIVFSAGEYTGVLYWYLAAFSLALPKSVAGTSNVRSSWRISSAPRDP